jgi:4-methylaminobutanoate oxidase (formaldehyde-forming)
VEKQRQNGVTSKLVSVTVNDPSVALWGGELLLRDGVPAGFTTSAAHGPTLGTGVGLAYVESDTIVDKDYITAGAYQLDVAGQIVDAQVSLRPPYDPSSLRLKA